MSTAQEQVAALLDRILVVDEDDSAYDFLAIAFPDQQLFRARSGDEALECIARDRPDLVIVDVHIPGTTAPDLVARVRQKSMGAALPFLVLATDPQDEVLYDCLLRGADDFLLRPLGETEFATRVMSAGLRQHLARDVNPLTRLPGNFVLKREIENRVKDSDTTAVCYIDLDHFKEFNDTRGFDRGDHVIQLVGSILADYADRREQDDVFVGHVGGDDFVAVLDIDQAHDLASHLFAQFDMATEVFYSPAEIERGSYIAANRRGEQEEIPLVSISVGVLCSARDGMNDLRRVSQVSAEVKKMAKQTAGNSIFVDRRK